MIHFEEITWNLSDVFHQHALISTTHAAERTIVHSLAQNRCIIPDSLQGGIIGEDERGADGGVAPEEMRRGMVG